MVTSFHYCYTIPLAANNVLFFLDPLPILFPFSLVYLKVVFWAPLLFLLYMDDLPSYLSSSETKIILFADDCKLFREIRSLQDVADLQNSISDLLDW